MWSWIELPYEYAGSSSCYCYRNNLNTLCSNYYFYFIKIIIFYRSMYSKKYGNSKTEHCKLAVKLNFLLYNIVCSLSHCLFIMNHFYYVFSTFTKLYRSPVMETLQFNSMRHVASIIVLLSVIAVLSVYRQWIGHTELARRKSSMCIVWLCATHLKRK